MKLTSTSV